MRKIFGTLALTVLAAAALTGCSDVSHTAVHDAATGRWVTAAVDNKPVGDMWCLHSLDDSDGSANCVWSTFTDPHTHPNTEQISADYRYVTASDNTQHRVLCVNYETTKDGLAYDCDLRHLAVGLR
jgi:hypothetical protein